VKQVVFHVGAHRSGSSTIQGMLKRRREELASAGLKVLVRNDLSRGVLLRQVFAMHRGSLRALATAWPIHRAPGTAIVVSEENLLGTMPGHRSVGFYPGYARAIDGLRLLGRMFDVRVRWIVRRQDRFLESVYAFRVSRGETEDFASFRARVGQGLHWLAIARALERSGLADVRIGLFEDLFDAGTERRIGEFLALPGSNGWPEPLRRGNIGMRGPLLHLMRHLNREANLDVDQRRGALRALRRLARRPGLPSARRLAGAFEAAGVPRLSPLASTALTFAASQPAPGFDDDGRRAFLREYEPENRELVRMALVQGRTDRWEEVSGPGGG